MTAIKEVRAREILDSRGNPTLEADVRLAGGALGRAAVPSGASTGSHEALELRDGEAGRFGGRGVLRAVAHVNGVLGPGVAGLRADLQPDVDAALIALDGTPNKSRLGANAVLAVSLAAARAAAAARGLPLHVHLGRVFGDPAHPPCLPVPLMNILNGGQHADNALEVQEFMIVPWGFDAFRDALRAGAEIYATLRRILKARGLSVAVGDEGGFAPRLPGNEAGLEVIGEAIRAAGYRPGEQVSLALDCAATSFSGASAGTYRFEGRALDASGLSGAYAAWAERHPLVSLEDPLGEDDWPGWTALTARLGNRVQLVGDDLFVTSAARIRRGIAERAGTSALIKVNQIGTLTETVEAVGVARQAGWSVIISHRSGETEDTSIADLAVSLGAGQIKTGAPCRGERVAKYNRLLRIEEELGPKARLASWPGRR